MYWPHFPKTIWNAASNVIVWQGGDAGRASARSAVYNGVALFFYLSSPGKAVTQVAPPHEVLFIMAWLLRP